MTKTRRIFYALLYTRKGISLDFLCILESKKKEFKKFTLSLSLSLFYNLIIKILIFALEICCDLFRGEI
jgi:hypothetical protein